jgi:hypothetical protein
MSFPQQVWNLNLKFELHPSSRQSLPLHQDVWRGLVFLPHVMFVLVGREYISLALRHHFVAANPHMARIDIRKRIFP